MTSYRISPAADADLDHQADYLSREVSLETALKFYAAASSTFTAITRNPGLGERRISSRPRLQGLHTWRVEGFENHLSSTEKPGRRLRLSASCMARAISTA